MDGMVIVDETTGKVWCGNYLVLNLSYAAEGLSGGARTTASSSLADRTDARQ